MNNHSVDQTSREALAANLKGSISSDLQINNCANKMRLQKVTSPVDVQNLQQIYNRKATTGKKPDKNQTGNTDSDFFNLTAEDNESQIDPVLFMRNISQVNSGTTSGIFIQESGS